MTLTPSNWKTFQHYKDRSPAWIKLHRAILDDADFQRLPVASRALAPMLWLLASEYEDGKITADLGAISWRLRISEDDLQIALKPLLQKFFVSDDSAVLAPCKRDAMPEKRREETEREEDSRVVAEATHPRPPDRFEEFWKAYPRRDGANPRAPAEKKFKALVKSGVDPEIMIAAVKALASAESAKGNIGTSFIPQAMTWLNQNRWSDHAAVAFLMAEADPAVQIEAAVKMYAKQRFWSKHAGPEPGQMGCRASAELLAKYGLQIDGRKIETALIGG